MKIFLASDHGGIVLKNKILEHLRNNKSEVIDMGAYENDPSDDYPDFVVPTMQNVTDNTDSRGIVLCRNGVGVCVLANKFNGVRCGLSFNTEHVIKARTDDDINVLSIPAEYVSPIEAFKMVDLFLSTPFSNAERHLRRLERIYDVESGNLPEHDEDQQS